MRFIFPAVVVSLLMFSCSQSEKGDDTPIVKAGNKVLTKQVLDENIPAGLSQNDSIIEAEHFIRTWITGVLMYDIAEKNTGDREYINQLVENYRKSLVIYHYQEQLINEKVIKTIREQDLYNYYKDNKEKFKSDQYLVKGVFLKVPIDAPEIEEIRNSYKSVSSMASREKLEKYSVRNAVTFDHFLDKWISFDELKNNWPEASSKALILKNGGNYFEQQDEGYYYFLNVTEFLSPDDFAPFEYAMPIVREMLVNQQKIDFLKQTENDIYQRALNKGDIKFYKE
ncbi:MAG: peptidyl-prolyl cis-trans isomerase [Candidatus Symbiothrix sp.]|jgi:hypothetical protein|nr:peptidyl-prolyl cis-trans isomerase [Candidatus Symbiothrix sp.]